MSYLFVKSTVKRVQEEDLTRECAVSPVAAVLVRLWMSQLPGVNAVLWSISWGTFNVLEQL